MLARKRTLRLKIVVYLRKVRAEIAQFKKTAYWKNRGLSPTQIFAADNCLSRMIAWKTAIEKYRILLRILELSIEDIVIIESEVERAIRESARDLRDLKSLIQQGGGNEESGKSPT